MRSERWWQKASVIEDLLENPASFEFIQAARLFRHGTVFNKDGHWSKDFQFNSSLKLNFPQTEIESLHIDGSQIQMTNLLVGLTGIQGALPYSYTNKIKHSSRQQREEALHFLNLFNHNLTAQYIDASINYNLPIRYEMEHENNYLNIIHALNGYINSQHEASDLEDYFAEFSGLMQGQTNTVYALKTILNCIFKADFQVSEFLATQFKLDDSQKTQLGGELNSQLGMNTFCGETVRQIDDRIEISIGPLNQQDYQEFLPRQPLSEKLKKLISIWCSPSLMVDVRLILKKEDIQPMYLNTGMSVGLSQGALLSPKLSIDNNETCYALIGKLQ
ncbi:type VI secretion system baseplate subunit TssG [Acinetobacter sp. ANC 3813]|uniref:type VI secretion system baseplate subunit TssG n=1 Tax=Acinetobacter sp. ANC 3813 TaxID=1977873 RepID=UPI000A34FF6A|nr:type VI secretion system baseplate subunit TssG [Acinetobacter sp. ANC 3813]OTG91403.1 type VI secretion protein [Acinetobacter sp. ANC 3813]